MKYLHCLIVEYKYSIFSYWFWAHYSIYSFLTAITTDFPVKMLWLPHPSLLWIHSSPREILHFAWLLYLKPWKTTLEQDKALLSCAQADMQETGSCVLISLCFEQSGLLQNCHVPSKGFQEHSWAALGVTPRRGDMLQNYKSIVLTWVLLLSPPFNIILLYNNKKRSNFSVLDNKTVSATFLQNIAAQEDMLQKNAK